VAKASYWSYWGVVCECGEFEPLKLMVSPGDNERPHVEVIHFICTHNSDGGWVTPQQLGSEKLVRRILPAPIKGFKPQPGLM
jgi:hypothetical protein